MGLADLLGIADLHCQKVKSTKWLKHKLRATLGVTSKRPHKIVHRLMGHPVVVASTDFWSMPKHKMIKYFFT